VVSSRAVRVGVLLVATGRYRSFLAPLLADVAAHFLRGHARTVFVFADAPPPPVDGLAVVHVPTAHEPWPGPTLHRYHYFTAARARLSETDVLFYLDVDTRVPGSVGDEVLPAEGGPGSGLVGVAHPGFCGRFAEEGALRKLARSLGLSAGPRRWLDTPRRGSYEGRRASAAYVAPHEGGAYLMGGFNGGRAPAFLAMAEHIAAAIDRDAARGIVAVWHDESHLNRYFIDHPPHILSPSYGFPEGWDAPFEARIVLLDKDHAAMRAPLGPCPISGAHKSAATPSRAPD
jgi:hypothetical protein